ncbi:MAG TPA: POTRA domain-containing protein [Caulobacteraceae bacterium]|nr:POTRA domain-containing protein [Caulobacteraceae bacterium]
MRFRLGAISILAFHRFQGARLDRDAPRAAAKAAQGLLAAFLLVLAAAPAAVGAPLSPNDPTQALPKGGPPGPSAPLNLPNTRPPVAPQDLTVRLVLRGVEFDGASAVPEARLRPAWEPLVGKPVTLGDLRAIGHRAEAIYEQAGYPFVAVVLKVQEVKDGIVHFDVVEGRISDLTVLGSNVAARRQATAALQPIVNVSPLSLGEVESTYQLAKQVPGLAISGTLRRGSQPGGMDLVVDAQRPTDFRTYINVNNLYADPVGPWGVLAGVDYFGSTEYGDQTSVQVYTSVPVGRQVLVRGSYALRLNSYGTTVTLSGLWGTADPKGSLTPLAIAEDVATVRGEVSQPLWERPDGSLLVDLGLEGSNQTTKVFRTIGLSDDRLRVLDFTLSGEKRGRLGRLSFSGEIRQGLNFGDASYPGEASLGRIGGDPQASIFRVAAEYESPTVSYVRLLARLDSQYSDRPLTTPDQYSIGNLTIGRGYQPGAALGDKALAGSTEVRFGPFALTKSLQIEPFGFYDVVSLWDNGIGTFRQHTIDSAGGGLRLQLGDKAHMDLIYAVPLAPALGLGDSTPTPSVLVNLTVGLNDAFAAIHNRLVSGTAK